MRLFLDRLKIEHKLAVLCSAFLLPIIFLTYLFIAETEKQVTFALKEVEGSSYVATLATELRTLIALSQGTTSLADLAKVLTLEPRHFGALTGLGAIMQDMGDEKAALVAFRQALAIDPHLEGVGDKVKTLAVKVEGQNI